MSAAPDATVAGPAFAGAVIAVAPWASRTPVIPIEGGIMISVRNGRLTLAARGDAVLSAGATVECRSREAAGAVVSARLLAGISATLDKRDVDLTFDDTAVRLRQGSYVATLPTMPTEDFPRPPVAPPALGVVDGAALADAVKRIAVAAGGIDVKPVALSTLLLNFTAEAVQIVGASREHFATTVLPWRFNEASLGPAGNGQADAAYPVAATLAKVAEVFAESGEVTIGCSASLLALSGPDREVILRVIPPGGEWPLAQVRSVLGLDMPHRITVERKSFTALIKQAVVVSEKAPVRLRIGGGEMTVIGAGDGPGSTNAIGVEGYAGEPVTVAFNPRYLTDALGAMPVATLTVEFGAGQPMLRFTTADDPHWRHVVAGITIRN